MALGRERNEVLSGILAGMVAKFLVVYRRESVMSLCLRMLLLASLSAVVFLSPVEAQTFANNPASPVDLGPSAVGVPTPAYGPTGPPFYFPFQILNSGSAPLILNYSFSTTEFSFDPATNLVNPVTVPPSSSVTGGLQFTPSQAGAQTGTFVSNDNAPGSPHSVQLTGTGFAVPNDDFAVVLDPAQASPVALKAGTTTKFSVWAIAGTQLCCASAELNTACSGGPAGATCTVNPSSAFGLDTTGGKFPLSRQLITVSVTVPVESAAVQVSPILRWGLPCVLLLLGLRSRRDSRRMLAAVFAFFVVIGFLSCGGSSTPTHPALVITSTQQTTSHMLMVPVTVN